MAQEWGSVSSIAEQSLSLNGGGGGAKPADCSFLNGIYRSLYFKNESNYQHIISFKIYI